MMIYTPLETEFILEIKETREYKEYNDIYDHAYENSLLCEHCGGANEVVVDEDMTMKLKESKKAARQAVLKAEESLLKTPKYRSLKLKMFMVVPMR